MKYLFAISCLLLTVATGNARADLSENLIGHFTFDANTIKEGDNGVANAVDGGAAGTVDLAPTPSGTITEEPNGLIKGAVGVAPTAAIAMLTDPTFADFGAQSFTFSGWIHPTKAPDQTNRLVPIIGKGRETQSSPGWAVFLRSADGEDSVQLAFAGLDQSGVGITLYPIIIGFELGKWYHVAAVVDRDDGTVTLYVDGIHLGSRPLGATAAINTEAPLTIARWGATPVAFDGLLDDFALWSRSLSAAEIADIYGKGLKGASFAPSKTP